MMDRLIGMGEAHRITKSIDCFSLKK